MKVSVHYLMMVNKMRQLYYNPQARPGKDFLNLG